MLSLSVLLVVPLCFPVQANTLHIIFYQNHCYIVKPKLTDDMLFWNQLTLPVEVVPVDVGIEIVVEGV